MSLRLLYFGTPAFAVPSLRALAASRHSVVGVVTQPDRPRGRGQKVTPSPVKAAALELGLPVLQPTRLKDDELNARLRELQCDLGVVAAYGKILPTPLLSLPRLGMINVHASLLPRWRGAAPIQRAILAGDTETGITIMRVIPELDAGPMLAAVPTPIASDETSVVLEQRLSGLGAELLIETIEAMARGPVTEASQNAAGVTYAARLERRDGQIGFDQPALAIHNAIRLLLPGRSFAWNQTRSSSRREQVQFG
jgi:methionyl-tRNA formyltransferase